MTRKVKTQSIEVKRSHEKFALGLSAPAARAPPICDGAVLPVLVIVMSPVPLGGLVAQGGRS